MRQNFATNRIMVLIFVLSIIFLAFSNLLAQTNEVSKLTRFFQFWLLPRVWVGATFCLIGLGILVKAKLKHNLRLLFLFLIFFVFAIYPALPLGKINYGMGIHPSPMCIITKPFGFLNAGRTVPLIFLSLLASIVILTIIGNKLFCGWVCPIGALQEIFHRVPLPEKFKIKLPFKITNLIRVSIFVIFIVLIFALGLSIYDYINPFEFLHWRFALFAIIILSTTLIASLFIFRPFCYLICPLGIVTWLFEQLSLIRVKVNNDKCTSCNICINKSPCPSVASILNKNRLRPDCHACGRCLEVCPENALKFKP
jgi:polyferredoxin